MDSKRSSKRNNNTHRGPDFGSDPSPAAERQRREAARERLARRTGATPPPAAHSTAHSGSKRAFAGSVGTHAAISSTHRSGTRPSTRKPAHGAKRRHPVRTVLIVVLVLVLIGGGAAFAYFGVINGNLRLGLGNVEKHLVKTDLTKEPFYLLLMGTDGSAERDATGDFGGTYRSESIMLARIDPVDKKATLVSIHRDTLVDMGQYGKNKLNAAHALGGPELSVDTVSQLAGVPISHYAEINFDGFRDIVNALGGIEVNVPMEIDDADAGGHLDAGAQTLNGDQALILCRARHAYDEYGDGDEYRAANQRLVLSAIAKKLRASDVVTMASTVQAFSQYVTTDLSVTDIIGLAQAMQGLNPDTDLYSAMEPTTSEYIDGVWYEINNADEWKTMMQRVDQGLPPTEDAQLDDATGTVMATNGTELNDADGADRVPKRSGSVSVRNGNGIAGAGQEASDLVTKMGYTVDSGNADNFDYPQTLVIYNDDSQKERAAELAKALGVGQPQKNNNVFLYQGDFLVLLGADWNQRATESE